MATRMQITGGKEIAAALKKLGAEVENNVMRGAMNAGAAVIGKDARKRARRLDMSPRGRARLANAIKWRRGRGKPGVVIAGVYVGSSKVGSESKAIKKKFGERSAGRTTNDPRVWWRWIEYGTQERFPRRQGVATVPIPGDGGIRFRRMGPDDSRGKIVAQPFLRPAFDQMQGAAVQEVADAAKRNLPKVLERLARKHAKKGRR